MWETIETVFYILMFLLLLTTFMPRKVRANVSDSVSHIWLFLKALIIYLEPIAYELVTGKHASLRQLRRAQHPPPVREAIPLPAAEKADIHGGTSTVDIGLVAPASPEEIRRLAVALRHNHTTEDKTKSGAIKAGWGISRSGSDPRYKRASELYDLANATLTPEEAFPALAAARKAATKQI